MGPDLQKKTLHASEQERPDVKEAREKWREEQPELEAGKLIFIDETGAATNMTRRYGRAQRGERCVAGVPFGHRKTATFIAALSTDGLRAPRVLDGPVNGESFTVYVRDVLCPALNPGDTVICDNLSSHKATGAAEALEACGAKLVFLPPYSPDLNPIEKFYSRLKSLLRKAGRRTLEGLVSGIAEVAQTVTPRECSNYFKACGYAVS
jgi:transposase